MSVNSKGGLDLDAGSILTVSRNRVGGLAIEQQSVMTIFNNPQFSGAPGFGALVATGNGAIGLSADNGSGITLRNTTLTGNTARDLRLTFDARTYKRL